MALNSFGNGWRGRAVCAGWLLLCAAGSGCSSGLDAEPMDAGGQPQAMDAGSDTVVASSTLCNGDPSVRLSYQTVGGGQTLPGSGVKYENGFRYLVVTGDCRYWVMTSADADVREGTLSPTEAAAVETDLRLADWSTLDPTYQRCGADVSGDLLRFGGTHVTISGCVGGAAPKWLVDGLEASLQSRYEAGAPVGGPVRFLLVAEGSGWSSNVEDRAAPWPLSIDPVSFAYSYEQVSRYAPGNSDLMPSPEAEALRKLRRDFFGSGGGPFSGGFIPVLGADGQRYELFVRDTIPLEDDVGLLHLQ